MPPLAPEFYQEDFEERVEMFALVPVLSVDDTNSTVVRASGKNIAKVRRSTRSFFTQKVKQDSVEFARSAAEAVQRSASGRGSGRSSRVVFRFPGAIAVRFAVQCIIMHTLLNR